MCDCLFDFIAQRRNISADFQFHISAAELFLNLHKIIVQQIHKCIDFLLRTGPVLGGKGINSKYTYAQGVAAVTDVFKNIRTAFVAGRTRQAAALCPSSVAVHYYAYMFGNIGHIKLCDVGFLFKKEHVCTSRVLLLSVLTLYFHRFARLGYIEFIAERNIRPSKP